MGSPTLKAIGDAIVQAVTGRHPDPAPGSEGDVGDAHGPAPKGQQYTDRDGHTAPDGEYQQMKLKPAQTPAQQQSAQSSSVSSSRGG